jgi:glycine/D-amino acid oxidase-like deaminating enzyme
MLTMNMAHENVPPWLREVKRIRPVIALTRDIDSDVAIVGGGISGVATSYFLLRDTSLCVDLIEKGRVAHGATGHNGGQAVAAFERPLTELCEKFGEEKVSEGLLAIIGAWKLLYSMIAETGIDVTLQEVKAHIGLSSLEDVLITLKERQLSDRLGLPSEDIFLAEDIARDVPREYQCLFKRRQRKEIDELLLTRDSSYISVLMVRTALMNSALFCEELVSWMLNKYPGRFSVYEDTKVKRIKVSKGSICGQDNGADLEAGKNIVNARHAVLCTNGYNELEIESQDVSEDVALKGLVGFMAGYMGRKMRDPAASVYLSSRRSGQESYFYLNRRNYIDGANRELTSVGGPDRPLRSNERYRPEDIPEAEEEYSKIEEFYRKTVIGVPADIRRDFSWHGLMGYTSSGVRVIGRDPNHSCLVYNMGCNGIGLLPSIYGGKRVAQIINGETLAPSIFDPIRPRH